MVQTADPHITVTVVGRDSLRKPYRDIVRISRLDKLRVLTVNSIIYCHSWMRWSQVIGYRIDYKEYGVEGLLGSKEVQINNNKVLFVGMSVFRSAPE